MSTRILKKFACACLLLLLGLSIAGNLMPQLRFIPEAHAEPDTPKARWIFFRDTHSDYGAEDQQRWFNMCNWIGDQTDIDLVLHGGDLVTDPRNDTAWDLVGQGVKKFNSSTAFLATVGNHDAFYNSSKGGGDYDRFKKFTGMSNPNYTFTFSKPGFGNVMVIVLAFQYTSSGWIIQDDQWDWFDAQVSSTEVPVVVMMHPAPSTKYVLHQHTGADDAYWDDHISQHKNVFMVLFGHSHETQYYIGKGANGNPILILTSYGDGSYESVHRTFLAILEWYPNKLEVKNYDQWTNTWINSTRDGEALTFYFAGPMEIESGHLRNDDMTRTGNNDTDVHSEPKSYYPAYDKYYKAEITRKRTSYWVQSWAHLKNPFMDRKQLSIVYQYSTETWTPISSQWKNNYFYPNGTSTINATLQEGWYNYIYFVNETLETYTIYVYNTSGSLQYSGTFNFIENIAGWYGFKYYLFRPYGYVDDIAVTYSTQVKTQSGTTITLPSGTQITDTSFDIRELTGAIMLLNCTVTIGDETRVMDIYGGDAIGLFYSQEMLLSAVADNNDDLKNNSNPYIWNVTRAITALSFSSTKLSLTVQAATGEKSITRVYCGDKGEPISVSGASSWSYDSQTKIVTLNVLHTSSKEIIVHFEQTPPTTTISLSGVLGSNDWFISEVLVTLSAMDDISGVDKTEYSFDNTTWTIYVTPFNITSEGNTVIYYKSTDKAGNLETIKNQTIKIDKTTPAGAIIINNGDAYTTSISVTLTLTATDATSGVFQVRFSNDGVWDTEPWEEWWTTEVPLSWYLPSGDGPKTVYFKIKDRAGLVSDTYTDTIILDITRPTGSITINDGATYTTTTTVALILLATDATSGVVHMRFSHDNITWTAWEDYVVSKAWNLTTGNGIKIVYVQFKDNAGLISQYYSDIIILDTTKPVADASVNQTVAEDIEVTFNGSASWDENGIASYTWTFIDITTKTLTGEKPTYTFNTPGVYTITLNVTDAAGNWATDVVLVTLIDITNPVAKAGQNQTVTVGTAMTFDASESTDNVGIVSYEWDFGDGTTGTGITATHTYTSTGSYTIALTIRDAASNTATGQITVTVLPVEAFPVWIIGVVIIVGIAMTIVFALRRENHSQNFIDI